jgi:hypothetical protein
MSRSGLVPGAKAGPASKAALYSAFSASSYVHSFQVSHAGTKKVTKEPELVASYRDWELCASRHLSGSGLYDLASMWDG